MALANARAVPLLVEFFVDALNGQSLLGVEEAASTIAACCSKSTSNRATFVKANVTTPLVTLLRSGSDAEKMLAAHALGSISKSSSGRKKVKMLGGIAALEELAATGSEEQVTYAKRALKLGGQDCIVS